MIVLLLGLALFLGVHSTRIFADDWRRAQIARIGLNPWKGMYTLISLVGLVLIVYGYGQTRIAPIELWSPPVFTRHLSGVLMIPAFILLAAAYVPGTRIRRAVGHPMVLGVKVWALSHILANGTLHDLLLFGGFLVWAVLSFRAARQRDRAALEAGDVAEKPPTSAAATVGAVLAGTAVWAAFIMVVHLWLIGVAPIAAMAV